MPLKSAVTLRSVLLPAFVAGITAGLLAASLQQLFLVPMILQAEAVELGGAEHVQHGLDRALYTTLFDCLGAFGHAIVLPAYGEGDELVLALKSVPPGPLGEVLVVLVVNGRSNSPEWVHERNRADQRVLHD